MKYLILLCSLLASSADAGSPVLWGDGQSLNLQTVSPLGQQAWVSEGGNDTTGTVGDASRPFATIAAAETAITDAAESKVYALHLGAGTFDVTGMTEKKSFISWVGAGIETTFITTSSSPIVLTNSGFSVALTNHVFNLSNLQLVGAVSMDAVAAGLVSNSDVRYFMQEVGFSNQATIEGLGADTMTVQFLSCFLQSGFNAENVNIQYISSGSFGSVNVVGSGSYGAQVLGFGSSILGNVSVLTADSTPVFFGMSGGIIGGGGITVDGIGAQAFLEDGVTQTWTKANGGTIAYLSQAAHMGYSPTTSGDWLTSPTTPALGLDYLAARVKPLLPGAYEAFYVLTVDDVGCSLNNSFFTYGGDQYTWFNCDSTGVDPAPGGTGHEVPYTSDDLAATLATGIETAGSGTFTCIATMGAANCTANTFGPMTDAADGSAPTGFDVTTTTQGGGIFLGTTRPDGINVDSTGNVAIEKAVTINDAGGNGGNVPHAVSRDSDTDATSATCSVTCASNHRALGGGCSNTVAVNLVNNYPSADDTWSCEYSLATGDCTAWAICASY